jgi:hypothetical protein
LPVEEELAQNPADIKMSLLFGAVGYNDCFASAQKRGPFTFHLHRIGYISPPAGKQEFWRERFDTAHSRSLAFSSIVARISLAASYIAVDM